MFAHFETLHKVRLATLDQYQTVATVQVDSLDRFLHFYMDTTAITLKTLRFYEVSSGLEPFNRIVSQMIEEHIHLVDHTQEDLIRLTESHVHHLSTLAKQSLGEFGYFVPPLLERSFNAGEVLLDAGESVVDQLGNASIQVIECVDQAVKRNNRKPRKR